MNVSIFDEIESNVRSYCRSFPAVFARAKGSYFYDEAGNRYIDFFCGAGAENYGHNNDYLKSKMIQYLSGDGVIHALDMFTTAKRELLETLQERILKPRGMNYKVQFPGPTGTNAMEAVLKLARKVKKRNDIWAFMGAFHGMTLGALALTTDVKSRHGAFIPLDHVTHIPAPYMFPELDVIKYMQTLLDDDHSGVEKPAALVMETVQAEGGVHVFGVDFLKKVEAFCQKNDILLIVDDIQVGCARTGTFFSFERAGIRPDMFVMSKSIGGYGIPLSLAFFKPEYDIWLPAEHNGTFRGNQLAFVTAKAGLEYMLDNHVEAETKRKGALVEEFVTREILPLDVRFSRRGIGLIQAIEFGGHPDETLCARVRKIAFENRLVIESAGRKDSALKIMPPLVIEDEILLEGLAILRDAIKKALVTKEG